MLELTERKALEICRDAWQWQTENPLEHKSSNPILFEYAEDYTFTNMFKSDCPACEYREQNNLRCTQCIIEWNKGLFRGGCMESRSPYVFWDNSDNETERREYALQIVNLCNEALDKLKD